MSVLHNCLGSSQGAAFLNIIPTFFTYKLMMIQFTHGIYLGINKTMQL